jgi:copper transport protein
MLRNLNVFRWLLLAAVSAALLAMGWVAPAAQAHAALLRSDPAAGAHLDTPPAAIRMWFAEPLETSYTGADLLDAAGNPVAATVAIAPDDDHQLVLTPPSGLADGAYTVAWRTLSAADGHTLQGYFGFRIGAGTASGFVPIAAPEGNETIRALTRGLALLGLAAVLALAPITLGVLDPTVSVVPTLGAALLVSLRRYGVIAGLLALVTSVAALAAQAVTISPGVPLLTALGQTLTDTRYGQIWVARLLLLLLGIATMMAALWSGATRRRPLLLLATIVGVTLPLPFSLLSHAAAEPIGESSAIAADALHLLAAATWSGGLLLIGAVLLPALRPLAAEQRREALRAAIPRFSLIGIAAWAVLLLSGLYAAWLQVGTLSALRETPYGQSLLLKGALLLPVLALAAFHFLLGRRGSGGNPAVVARTLAAEAILVIAVLLVVGRLIGQEPAREVLASRQPAQLVAPLDFATHDAARQGRLVIAPGAAGVNTFTLEVDGAPLPAGSEGVLRFASSSHEMGEQELTLPQAGPNRFTAEGPELALAGDWRLQVLVRKIGGFSWQTQIPLRVADTPPAALEPNPAPRFSSGGIAGMLALAIGVAGLATASLSPGAPRNRRLSGAAVGAVALVVGVVLLVESRLPPAPSAPVLAQSAAPGTPVAAVASPPAMSAHDHDMMMSDIATPVSPPGVGTPVREDGIVVMVTAERAPPGPTDITVDLRDPNGAPLPDARVVVFAEMAGMGPAGQGTPAAEVAPGRYVAPDVSLGMAGDWQLKVRVSPKGQPTQVFPVVLTVSTEGQ